MSSNPVKMSNEELFRKLRESYNFVAAGEVILSHGAGQELTALVKSGMRANQAIIDALEAELARRRQSEGVSYVG